MVLSKVLFWLILLYQKTRQMNIKDTQTGIEGIICIGPDTEENRKLITKDITAAMRWYSSSNARYDDDDQSLYRLSQLLETVHRLRRAS